mgnify:FL=1|tara:strand:+ start:144 stop:476 length:333 start_codon:yes stop_codon:yes gene_type:complete
MPIKKGDKIKRPGRPKGVANKSTAQIKNAFQALLTMSLPKMIKDLDSLEPKDRLNILIKLSDKILPSLKAVDQVVETKGVQQLGFTLNYNNDETDKNTLEVPIITPKLKK